MFRLCVLSVACVVLVGGCPLQDPAARYQSTIDAHITIYSDSGEAPLHVVVSAQQSTSARGAIVKYTWDFAGQAHAEGALAEHTFSSPGRYPITLTVVNADGEQASERVYVRVSGGDVTAVIWADRLSGPAPLAVSFDGSDSSAVDDAILDYYWDFGDGGQSRRAAPTHLYDSPGTFTVTLRVVSAGGVEGSAQTAITVGADAAASLQFNGAQFATLPVQVSEPLSAFTFEAWCNPESEGGTIVNFGLPNVGIELSPSAGTIALRSGGETYDAAAAVEAGRWQHVAVAYSSDAGATVYLAAAPVATLPLTGEFDVNLLSLGAGFRGKLARIRFWSANRSDAEIAASVSGTLTGFEEGLLGDWPLSDGSGQTLRNSADGGEDGTLGAGAAQESSDPAWSTDSP